MKIHDRLYINGAWTPSSSATSLEFRNAPFGGFKQSGHGREFGKYGLEEYLELKFLQLTDKA
jgi:acyl-CoA reductase-like NAD-dependent aldehyde dehydrogenase